MPKIPDASSITRNIASGQRAVRGIDMRNFAPTELAQSISRMVDKKDKFETTKAETDFLTIKNEQDNAYDQDTDYGTIESRYSTEMDKRLGEVSMGISNPAARAEFIRRNQLRISQGKERMKKVAFGKERDFERNYVNESLTKLREVAVAGEPEDVNNARETVKGLIDSAIEMGYYSNEEAGKIKQQWRTDSAVGRLNTMDADTRIEALNMPWAKDLPSDVRQKLHDQAEEATFAQKAVDTVDEYLLADMDRGQAMLEAGKLPDERLRKEVERRFDYMYGKQKEFETEERSEIFDKYYLDVRQGEITVDDIPNDELRRLSPAQQNNLFSAQSSSVGRTRTVSDRATVDMLHGLQQTGKFRELREFFIANSNKLNETAFNTWSKVSRKGEMPVEVKSMLTTQQRMNAKLQNAEITDNKAKSKLSGAMDDWYMNYQAENDGKLPTDDQTDKQMDRLLMQYDTSWWWGGTKPIFEMSEDERRDMIGDLEDEEPDLFNAIKDAYTSRGVDPTPEQFLETYQNAIKQRQR